MQKGFWAALGTCMVLLIGFSGDTGFSRDYRQSDDIRASVVVVSETNVVDTNDIAANNIDLNTEESDSPEEQILTLLTFNIHSANDMNGTIELGQIIEEIRETDAQLIGLQEVERNMPRSGYQDQARLIAEALGYHYYYGGNINILGVQYGNALISKFPILAANNHNLPREKLEPRGVIEAEVDVEGMPYHLYVTHLGLNPVERQRQVEYINELVTQKEGNVLLLGDFNNLPDSPEMVQLDPRMVDTAAALDKGSLYTFSQWSDFPNVRIDRIYTSKEIKLKNHEVMPSAVSDHAMVLTQIIHEIQPGEGIYNALANTDSNKTTLPMDE